MIAARWRLSRRHRGYLLSVVVLCCALVAQNLLPLQAHASQDPYDLMTIQLNEIVDQRASMLRELGVADGAVGSILARDILAALHPALLVQRQLLSGVANQVAAAREIAPRTPVASDRSVAPGVLLGPHMPAMAASDLGPPISPEKERADAWRQSLLDATSLTVASAALVEPVTTGGSTYTSFASSQPDISTSMAPPPMTYQSLGDAADLQPLHEVEVNSAHIAVQAIAPQAVVEPQYLPNPAATITPSQTPLHGLVAVGAYNKVAQALPVALGQVAAPTALLSKGLDTTALITNMDAIQSTIGKYQLPLGGGSSPFSGTQTLASFIAPQVTWSFTSTAAMTNGSTLLAQGSAESDGGAVHSITLSAFNVPGSPPSVPGAPSASLSLALDGTGVLTAVTPISGTTTVTTIVRVPGLSNDPALQGALSRERLVLAELGGTLQTGNALFDRLKPIYDARLAVYNKQLSAVVSSNSIIEQAWWDKSQRYADYQTKLAKWQEQKDAWDRHLKDIATATPEVAPNQMPTRVANAKTDRTPAAGSGSGGKHGTSTSPSTPQATAATAPTSVRGHIFGNTHAPFSDTVGVTDSRTLQMLGPRPLDTAVAANYSTVTPGATIGPSSGDSGTPALASDSSPTPTTVSAVTAAVTESASPGPGGSPEPSPPSTPAATVAQSATAQASVSATATSEASTIVVASDTPTPDLSLAGSVSPTETPVPSLSHGTANGPDATGTSTPINQSSATSTPGAGAVAATDTATPAVDAPAATDTATPSDEPSDTSTPIARASVPTDTATPASHPSDTSTPAVDGPPATDTATPVGVPTAIESATVTGSASPLASATPDRSGGSETATGNGSQLAIASPGPKPEEVSPPGPEPVSEPLPPPLPPLPGWVTPSVPVSPVSFTNLTSHGLGPSGYANLTQQELVADGALTNVPGYQPPLRGVITTYFGGSTPWQSFHTGVDIATTDGTPVHAAAGGIVLYAGLAVPGVPTMSYGNCVVIMHNAHISTLYGHMQIGQHDLQVRAGEVVTAGQVIGYEGATGWATGPHVHFEMRLNNVAFDPLLLVGVQQITG